MMATARVGRARTFGAISVVNAIATGKGASLGVELACEARVELRESGHVIVDARAAHATGAMPTALPRAAVTRAFEWAGVPDMGAWVSTQSAIPVSRGLKSSSAAANAIVIASLEALGKLDTATDEQILALGVEAAKRAGVTITGAYDDACASLYGGLCVTDNAARSLVKRVEVPPDLVAVIHVPPREIRKSDIAKLDYRSIEPRVAAAWEKALSGDYATAMRENGEAYARLLGVPIEPANAAISAGAISAGMSGTGPATAALVDPANVRAVARALEQFEGAVLQARVNNRGSGVIRRSP